MILYSFEIYMILILNHFYFVHINKNKTTKITPEIVWFYLIINDIKTLLYNFVVCSFKIYVK